MCSAGSELEIFSRFQYLPSAGVKGANGMCSHRCHMYLLA